VLLVVLEFLEVKKSTSATTTTVDMSMIAIPTTTISRIVFFIAHKARLSDIAKAGGIHYNNQPDRVNARAIVGHRRPTLG
jgi:hypothetical protein